MWIDRATKVSNWTKIASRISRGANRRTEIHECGIVVASVVLRQKLRGVFPKRLTSSAGVDSNLEVKEPRDHTRDVCFDNRHRLIEREACNRVCGVAPDTGKLLEFLNSLWQRATKVSADN